MWIQIPFRISGIILTLEELSLIGTESNYAKEHPTCGQIYFSGLW